MFALLIFFVSSISPLIALHGLRGMSTGSFGSHGCRSVNFFFCRPKANAIGLIVPAYDDGGRARLDFRTQFADGRRAPTSTLAAVTRTPHPSAPYPGRVPVVLNLGDSSITRGRPGPSLRAPRNLRRGNRKNTGLIYICNFS